MSYSSEDDLITEENGNPVTKEDIAIKHLGDVLYLLCDLHPDDRCRALDEALEFYNKERPNWRVEPSGLGYQRLTDQY